MTFSIRALMSITFLLFFSTALFSAEDGSKAQAGSSYLVIGSGDPFDFKVETSVQNFKNTGYNAKFANNFKNTGFSAKYGDKVVSTRYISRYDGTAVAQFTLTYDGGTYLFSKRQDLSSGGIQDKAWSDLVLLSEKLAKNETMALTLMKKNIGVIDDTAGVIVDKPEMELDQSFPPRHQAKHQAGFRYALMLELEGASVKSYKFFRQGE